MTSRCAVVYRQDTICLDTPRPSNDPSKTNHGGVAAIVSRHLSWKIISPLVVPTTFESTCFSVTRSSNTVVVLLIHRPSTTPITDTFFIELSNYLEVVALYKCQIIVAGDLNIHVERRASDLHAVKLHELLDSFDCVQHFPHIPTHRDGGTLDLVIHLT